MVKAYTIYLPTQPPVHRQLSSLLAFLLPLGLVTVEMQFFYSKTQFFYSEQEGAGTSRADRELEA